MRAASGSGLQLPEASAVLLRAVLHLRSSTGNPRTSSSFKDSRAWWGSPDYPGSCPRLTSLPSVSSAVSSLSPRKVTWAQALGTGLWTSLGAIFQPAMCPPERNGEAGILSSVVSPGKMSDPWTVVPASLFSPAPWGCRSSVHVLLPCYKSRPCSRCHLSSSIHPSPFTAHSLREVAGAGVRAWGKTQQPCPLELPS